MFYVIFRACYVPAFFHISTTAWYLLYRDHIVNYIVPIQLWFVSLITYGKHALYHSDKSTRARNSVCYMQKYHCAVAFFSTWNWYCHRSFHTTVVFKWNIHRSECNLLCNNINALFTDHVTIKNVDVPPRHTVLHMCALIINLWIANKAGSISYPIWCQHNSTLN